VTRPAARRRAAQRRGRDRRGRQERAPDRHARDPRAPHRDAVQAARAIARRLRLAPHPEGGWYREIVRSRLEVDAGDGRGPRAALTTIHYLLAAGERSRWHRVRSDEIWFLLAGGLDLFLLGPDLAPERTVHLGALAPERLAGAARTGRTPGSRARRAATPPHLHVVPAGWWQAARPRGPYALAACIVAPGFDFADFDLLADNRGLAAALARRRPRLARLL
jgi:predicted cupin superfamily sugar epimerase